MDDFSAFPAVKAPAVAAPAAAGAEDFSAFPAVNTSASTAPAVVAVPTQAPQGSSLPGLLGQFQNTSLALQSGANQGMTLGFGDELNAGFMTPIQMAVDAIQGKGFDPGGSYNRALEGTRALNTEAEQLNPIANTVGQIVGAGVLGGTAAGGGLTLMNGASPSLLSIVPRAAAEGAIYGGINGAGNGTDWGDRLHQAGFGAATGAGTGGVLGGLVGALAARAANKTGIPSDAVAMVRNAIMGDPNAAANIAAAGHQAMVADAGPNSAQLLDLAMQRAGPAANIAQSAVQGRAADANQLVADALMQHLGQGKGLESISQDLRSSTQPAIKAAYDTAYATPIDYNSADGKDVLAALDRVPQSIKNNAASMMQMEGVAPNVPAAPAQQGTIPAFISPTLPNGNPNPVYMQMVKGGSTPGADAIPDRPTLQQIDYIKRALSDAADSGDGAGAMGGVNNKGRIYQSLAADLRDSARLAVPEYGDALALASDPITARSAAKFGSTMLSPSVPMDVVQHRVATMTPADIESLKQGVAGNINEVVANVRAAASDPNLDARQAQQALAMLSSDAARAKLGAIPGLDVAGLTRQLDEASKGLQLRASTAANSKTFARMSADDTLNEAMNAGLVNQLRRAEPINAAKSVVQALTRSTPKAQSAYKQQVFSQVADALTKARGADAGAFADQIVKAGGPMSKGAQTLVNAIIAASGEQGRRAGLHYLLPAAQ